MRILLLLFFLFTAYAYELPAQTCATHPTDTSAVLLGSFIVSLDLSATSASLRSWQSSSLGDGCIIEESICVWATDSGIDIVGDLGSVSASGDCDMIDTLSTLQLVDLLSQQAVLEAADLNYISCSSTCASPMQTRVLQALCVTRDSTGAATTFTQCTGAGYSVRTYACCESGDPVLVSTLGGTCATYGCEPTGTTTIGSGTME